MTNYGGAKPQGNQFVTFATSCPSLRSITLPVSCVSTCYSVSASWPVVSSKTIGFAELRISFGGMYRAPLSRYRIGCIVRPHGAVAGPSRPCECTTNPGPRPHTAVVWLCCSSSNRLPPKATGCPAILCPEFAIHNPSEPEWKPWVTLS